jgi:hypothetical protein
MTAEMMTLFDTPEPQHDLTLREKFCIFHVRNPQVYRELERMTAELVARGRTRASVKTLIECLRWNYWMATSDPNSEFAVNNSYASFYSRLIMDEHPEFGQIFETRERDHQ